MILVPLDPVFGVTLDKIPSDFTRFGGWSSFSHPLRAGSRWFTDDFESSRSAVWFLLTWGQMAQYGWWTSHHKRGLWCWICWFQRSSEFEKFTILDVYIEPGEAIALNAGYLATEVLDIVENGMETLVLDASATCHMPDVLEMPYRPPFGEMVLRHRKAYTYRLPSNTCLTGDVIDDYSFEKPVEIGDRPLFWRHGYLLLCQK